jgi:hypothetical protein
MTRRAAAAAAGLTLATAGLPRVVPLVGWIVLAVVALAVVALVWSALHDDDKADRLTRILHGPRHRR